MLHEDNKVHITFCYWLSQKNGGAHMLRIRGVKVGDDHLMQLVFVELSNITAFDSILLIKFKVNKLEIPRR
mgnify:FL=1